MRRKLNAIALLLLTSPPVFAADIRRLSVTQEADQYILSSEMDIAAPQSAIFRVLSDYGHWTRLSQTIVSSRIISISSDGHSLVHSHTRFCLLLFCADIAQIQNISQTDTREIIAVTLPERSNLRQGLVHWRLRPENGGTRVSLDARLTPDFWVPPLIGPWSIKTVLREQALEGAGNLETLAMASARQEVPASLPVQP